MTFNLFQEEVSTCIYDVAYFSCSNPFIKTSLQIDNSMVKITDWVCGFEIQDSMEMAFKVGNLYIRFTEDFQKMVQFTGNDFFVINYASSFEINKTLSPTKNVVFRVVGITEEVPAEIENANEKYKSQLMCLSLAESPFFDLLVSQYHGVTFPWIDDSELMDQGYDGISGILTEYLQNLLNKHSLDLILNIEDTDDTLDITKNINFYSPNWTPLKTINYIKRFASSLIGGYSYYNLNCRDNTINIYSIDSLYNSKINTAATTTYMSRDYFNNPNAKYTISNYSNLILHHKYNWYNGNDIAFNGFGGQTNYTKGFKGNHKFIAFDFREYKKEETPKDPYWLYSQKHGDQWSDMRYCPYDKPHLIKNLNRYNYSKKLFSSVVVEVVTYISSLRSIGDVSRMLIPSSKGIIDANFNDNLMLWSIVDKVGLGKNAVSKLTFKKNSFTGANGGNFGQLINI
jgi:hypothetical protein